MAIKANIATMNKPPPLTHEFAFFLCLALNASKSNPQLWHFFTTKPIGVLHLEQADINNSIIVLVSVRDVAQLSNKNIINKKSQVQKFIFESKILKWLRR
jgi:hypothetical protein